MCLYAYKNIPCPPILWKQKKYIFFSGHITKKRRGGGGTPTNNQSIYFFYTFFKVTTKPREREADKCPKEPVQIQDSPARFRAIPNPALKVHIW